MKSKRSSRPEQLQSLKEITFRTFAFGSGIMFEPEVLDKFGMTAKQKDELKNSRPIF